MVVPSENRIRLYADGRPWIMIDADEFEIIKMMVEDAGGLDPEKPKFEVLKMVYEDLEAQGYGSQAKMLAIVARNALLDDHGISG